MKPGFSNNQSIEFAELEIFVTVVEAGTVTLASKRLHRVPSNVSTRLRRLEDKLGKRLFVRTGRRLELTPDGVVLTRYAREILGLTREAAEALTGSIMTGAFRLGSMDSTAAMRLPAVLSAFHRDHPELALELSSGTTNHLTERVISSELDAALIADVQTCGETRIESMHVFDETLVIVAENGHARIRSPHDVSRRTLLAFGRGCAYRQRLYDWFTRCGIVPERIADLGSYHAILGSIAAGMGVALLPEQLLRFTTYGNLLSVHPIESDQARSVTSLIWRRGDERNTALNAFVKTLSQIVEPRI